MALSLNEGSTAQIEEHIGALRPWEYKWLKNVRNVDESCDFHVVSVGRRVIAIDIHCGVPCKLNMDPDMHDGRSEASFSIKFKAVRSSHCGAMIGVLLLNRCEASNISKQINMYCFT